MYIVHRQQITVAVKKHKMHHASTALYNQTSLHLPLHSTLYIVRTTTYIDLKNGGNVWKNKVWVPFAAGSGSSKSRLGPGMWAHFWAS